MNKSNLIRNFFCFWLFLAAINAFADNLNIYGQSGIHKTQSARTLGHGRFGIGLFAEGMGLENLVENQQFCVEGDCSTTISSYMGGNMYLFLSLGLSNYFDFAFSIPIYGDYLRITNENGFVSSDNLSAGAWGDLRFSSKFSIPFGEDFPINLALIFGLSIPTGRQNFGELNNYGPWVRDPSYLYVGDEQLQVPPSPYTNTNTSGKFGLAATLDFGKMKHKIPLLFHLNYGYRSVFGEGGKDFPNVQNISAALELTPVEFLTLFGEYYTDMPVKYPEITTGESLGAADLSTVTFGLSFHLTKRVDFQLGFQFLLGDESKYTNLYIPSGGVPEWHDPNNYYRYGDKDYIKYNGRTVPKSLAFGGLTVKLFVIEEEEEEEYRNPDTDGDRVCDPWVRETGRQREFASVCTGIDLCPYEEGGLGSKGCPEEEEGEYEPPTVIFNSSQESITAGQFVSLNWVTTNAENVTIEGIGEVSTQGSRRVKPTETTTYTITAKGPGGSKTEMLEVIVESAAGPSVTFSASQETVKPGQMVTLTWMVTDATEVTIEGIEGVSAVPSNGSRRIRPSETATYTIVAKGQGGTKREMIEVIVESADLPKIIFTASAESVQKGQNVTLNWRVDNADQVNLEGIGPVQPQGSRRVKMNESRMFSLTATGPGGSQTATVEVEVEVPPPIEKQVNLKGVNFQSGKAELTLDAKRVLDGVAEQLLASPNVKIEIHGHTDNVGSASTNKDLSERRAKAVVGYLASQGVRANRMRAVGFGPDVPIADNKTADGRELNRRIEMIRVD